jgi:2-amino-4-hydroxy-6-hydroxymethyldihydropteridine diphosphokinase
VIRSYLGLGSNLGDRAACLNRAVAVLAGVPGLTVAARSPIYETPPWGDPDQPDFLNAALAVDTRLTPEALLAAALDVEARLGRERGQRRWGPRVIDVDVLLYGDLRRDAPAPALPHPRLHQRAFALRPLLDLDPRIVVPGRGAAADLLRALGERLRPWGALDA